MAISVAQARQLCTKAELDLVLQSTTRQIGTLDVKQLRSASRRARTARDKWRDRSESQTRDSKAKGSEAVERPNARSGEKAQLFDEALGRFEKRLARLEKSSNGAANAPAPRRRAPAKPATEPSAATQKPAEVDGKPVKKRADRKAVAKKGAAKKAAPKRRVAPMASTDRAAAGKPAGPTAPATHGLAAAAIAAGREGGGDQPTATDKKRNLKAKTAAKATAVSRSGAPRIQGHVSSQGRRNQAKRSSR